MRGHLFKISTYFVLVLTVLLGYQAVEAHNHVGHSKSLFGSTTHDVTGDKKNDRVELTGTYSGKNQKWLKELKVIVKSKHQMISVPLEAGSQPQLTIADFNQDGAQDVLVSMKKQEDTELISTILSFKGEKVTYIDVPPPVAVTAQFQDHYVAEIRVEGQKSVQLDMSNQQNLYEKLGIYQNGKLNEATELIVDPYSEFTVRSSFGHGKGLLGKQLIKDVEGEDAIAIISTSWTYKEGAWTLNEVKVKPLKKKKIA